MITNTQILLAVTMSLILVVSITPAFAQAGDPALASGTPNSIPSTGMSVNLIQQNSVTCALIDFEGGGNEVPIGVILNAVSDATFANNLETWIDFDAGGIANMANEPSPDTAMILNFQSGPGIMTLATPIDEIHFFHTTNGAGTQVTLFDSSNAVIATIPLPFTPAGAGDPNGGLFGTWNFISFNDPLGDIKSVEFTGSGTSGPRTFYDNLELCFTDSTVGGEFLPIDSTALLLAGAQTNAVWIMSALAVIGSIAFGALYITSKRN